MYRECWQIRERGPYCLMHSFDNVGSIAPRSHFQHLVSPDLKSLSIEASEKCNKSGKTLDQRESFFKQPLILFQATFNPFTNIL